ncbi:type I-C CRISPR-associated protein Cas8c/Csd1 [Aeribacillus sp. FSL K6-1121]|uniref:helix-turn-helix domain-containing protein n=1 Tax=Aeribacillus sp. FSL K6-1121 TaxID=2954745 RepID=UPI0030FAABEB
MNRDIKFGRLLAIANILSEKVFEEGKQSVVQKYMSRYSQKPEKTFQKIHEELLEYTPKFGQDEMVLLDMFGEILADMDESEFTNEPLTPKYLHAFHSQQHRLSNLIGVEEAAKILGLSPGTIKNKCAAGELPAVKIGKTWVMDKTLLD